MRKETKQIWKTIIYLFVFMSLIIYVSLQADILTVEIKSLKDMGLITPAEKEYLDRLITLRAAYIIMDIAIAIALIYNIINLGVIIFKTSAKNGKVQSKKQ